MTWERAVILALRRFKDKTKKRRERDNPWVRRCQNASRRFLKRTPRSP